MHPVQHENSFKINETLAYNVSIILKKLFKQIFLFMSNYYTNSKS